MQASWAVVVLGRRTGRKATGKRSDDGRGITSAARFFGAGVGLNCNTASVVVVAQSHARYVDEFDVISHAVGPKGKCWFPALSEPNDEGPDAGARAPSSATI